MNMKYAGAVMLAAVGFSAPTLAADLPARGPVYAKAPVMVAPAFSWQRCYIGAHAGYGWGRSTSNLTFYDQDTSGWLAGGQVGCNWMMTPSLLLGVEGDLWWSDIKGSRSYTFNTITSFSNTLNTRNRWDADLTLRLGMPIDRALIYLKGGAAYGNFSYGLDVRSADVSKWGWLIGGGLEYAVAPNWSTKLEYNYIDYGASDVTFPTGGGLRATDRKHVLKIGINYLFGGPVVARY